jgi:polar amino acid transport system substrate-binding protein
MTVNDFLRRFGMAFATVLALGTFAVACGDDNGDDGASLVDQAQEDGITIGIANERPYGYEEGGEPTGEAPEVAKVVFERMGITDVDFSTQDFGNLINGLNADRFDVIAAGMFITPERAEQVLFSDPDYCAATAFAVPEGNPDNVTDFESVAESGVTLGVLSGAVEEGYATDLGVPEGQISAFQEVPDLFDGLEAGRVDAVALTSVTIAEQTEELSGFESTEPFIPVIDGEEQLGCGAFAFRFDNQEFRDAFNDVLNEMKANDEILPIVEEFGFTATEIDAAKDVTVSDFTGDENE